MSEELLKAVRENREAIEKQLGDALAKHTQEIELHGKASTELTGKIDKLSGEYSEIKSQLLELAQKMEGKKQESAIILSAGAEFVKSDVYKAFAEGRTEKARLHVKNTVVSDSTTTFTTQRQGIIVGSSVPLTVRQLIPTITVSGTSVSALREASFTNSAAEVAQAAAKAESALTFAPYNVQIETVAHWIKVSNQLMQDAPAVMSYIDARLRYGLQNRIDNQLINGNGTTPNISGLTDAGNFTAFTATSGANLVESINKAKYNRWAVGEIVDTVIVNPADWAAMETLREGAGTGAYLYGAPGTTAGKNPFGLNVVMSPFMTAGQFLIGALATSAIIYQNQGATVEMGYVNDDFTKNLVTIRAEERLGLGVDRPAGIMYGAITAV